MIHMIMARHDDFGYEYKIDPMLHQMTAQQLIELASCQELSIELVHARARF